MVVMSMMSGLVHTIIQTCWHACTTFSSVLRLSTKLGQIREIKVSMKSGEHTGAVQAHNMTQAYKLVYMQTFSCMHRLISQPNWVGSEWLSYLWNQENMLDLSEHIEWPKHTSYLHFFSHISFFNISHFFLHPHHTVLTYFLTAQFSPFLSLFHTLLSVFPPTSHFFSHFSHFF